MAWEQGGMERPNDDRAIPDVSEGKRERNGANRPVLHLERGFFGTGISEIHAGALAGREPVALDAGRSVS
jgi:hypothetical protein